MNDCLKLLLVSVAVFAISASSASAVTYYVKNGGNDSANGLSDASAWATIGKVNTVNFASDDVIGFKGGSTFYDATMTLAGVSGTGKTLTIQAYGIGRPLFDGDRVRTMKISNTAINTFIIKDLEISGQAFQLTDSKMCVIENINNVSIDNIYGNGSGGSVPGNPIGQYGHGVFYIYKGTGHIEIKNCNLFNWGPDSMPQDNIGDTYALEIDSKTSGTFSVHNNLIHNINSDAIQIRAFTGALGEVYDNDFYNCGENAVDIKSSSFLDVRNNNFYRTSDFVGNGGMGGDGYPLISVIPTDEVGVKTSNYNKIHGNYLHDNPGSDAFYIGFTVAGYTCTGNEFYENYVTKTSYGMTLGSAAVGTKIYSNLIVDTANFGYWENNEQLGSNATKIYNNTFVNKTNGYRLLFLEYSNATVKNNIFYLTDASDYAVYKTGGTPAMDYNIYFNAAPGAQNLISYEGTVYTEQSQTVWNSGHSHDVFADPGLMDVASSRLWASSESSLIVDTGLSSIGEAWDSGLLYPSVWTPNFNLKTALGSNSNGRDKGAYEYASSLDTAAPSAPTGLSVI